jgi:hypothetical protein
MAVDAAWLDWTWAVTLASLIGVELNIRKNPACFGVWAVTNACWCVYDLSLGAYAQAALFAVYFVQSVRGLVKWRAKPP